MKYDNGKVYTLRSFKTKDIYIGSTTQTLSKRLYQHKKTYKSYKNGKGFYITSFNLFDVGDVYIELLTDYPCNNRNELMRCEGQYIRDMQCVNKVIPGRTRAEYNEDNKVIMLKKEKERYPYRKIKITCCCGSEISRRNIAPHKKTDIHFDKMTYKFFYE